MKIFSRLSQRVAAYLKPLNRKWKRQVSCEIVDMLWKLSSFVKYCFAALDLTDSSTQDIAVVLLVSFVLFLQFACCI